LLDKHISSGGQQDSTVKLLNHHSENRSGTPASATVNPKQRGKYALAIPLQYCTAWRQRLSVIRPLSRRGALPKRLEVRDIPANFLKSLLPSLYAASISGGQGIATGRIFDTAISIRAARWLRKLLLPPSIRQKEEPSRRNRWRAGRFQIALVAIGPYRVPISVPAAADRC
jgi:hypothetical protein